MRTCFLLIIAIIPSAIILRLIYKKDVEKEPLKLLFGLFGTGVISAFIAIYISFVLNVIFPNFSPENIEGFDLIKASIYSFVFVALVEETIKWVFNYSIVFEHKQFNHIYDSIVYSVFIALGFGTFENILYVLNYGFNIGILRGIISIPTHAFYGVFMGYYIGMSKLAYLNGSKKLEKKYRIYSLLVPILLHGFFDFCLFSHNSLFILVFSIFVIFLYIKSIKIIKKLSNIKTNLY